MIDRFIAHNTFPRNYVSVACHESKEELSMNPDTVKTYLEKLVADREQAVAEMVKYKAFWDQARLTDKETFEHYEWKKWGKE